MRILNLVCFVFLFSACAHAPVAKDESQTISVGEMSFLSLDFSPREILVSDPAKIEVIRRGTNEITMRALNAGSGTVIILKEDGSVGKRFGLQILPSNIVGQIQSVREMLRNVQDIHIYGIYDKVVIEGAVVSPREMDQIAKVAEAYPDLVVNLATISKKLYELSAQEMEQEIQSDKGGKGVKVKIINGTFVLLGEVAGAADRERAEAIAQMLLPEFMVSPALKSGVVVAGAKKYALRNLIVVRSK